jgi:hypothetical protein
MNKTHLRPIRSEVDTPDPHQRTAHNHATKNIRNIKGPSIVTQPLFFLKKLYIDR